MTPGECVAAAARDLIGVRFRSHGRDPAHGLDCVGLAAVALTAGGFRGEVLGGYALRGGIADDVVARIDAAGLARVSDAATGDLLLLATGPGQLHLAIDSGQGVIHADAMLRRAVERPGALPWPVIARWRLPN